MPLLKKTCPYEHWEHINANNGDILRVVPERGGLITGWSCNGREMLYLDQDRFKDTSKSIRGGIPILFPICGNLPDNKCFFRGVEYVINQHGFARSLPWNLNTLEDNKGVLLSLNHNKYTLGCFPYQFSLKVEARTLNKSLEIISRIKNHSDTTMPFNFGLHPYFLVKDLSKVTIDGMPSKSINQKDMLEVSTASELQRLPYGVDFLSGPCDSIILRESSEDISLELITEEPFDLKVIWTDPPRKMVCLEPWTSPRNSLINGNRIVNLHPGKSQILKTKIIFN